MRQTADFERFKLAEIGLSALEDETGLAIFEVALECAEPQLMGLVGQHDKVRSLIESNEEQSIDAQQVRTRLRAPQSTGDLASRDESATCSGGAPIASGSFLSL